MPPVAPTFQQVLQRLLDDKEAGIGSVNALAKRFSEIYGGTRDDNRKQIRRHLGSANKRAVEPEEDMIGRYANAFSVDRSVFPPAVSPRLARSRALAQARVLLGRYAEIEPQIREEVAEILSWLPDPPANPGRPTKPRPQKQ